MPPACRRRPSELAVDVALFTSMRIAIDVHHWRMGHRCMLQVERCTQHNPLSAPFNLEHAFPSRSHVPDVDSMRT